MDGILFRTLTSNPHSMNTHKHPQTPIFQINVQINTHRFDGSPIIARLIRLPGHRSMAATRGGDRFGPIAP